MLVHGEGEITFVELLKAIAHHPTEFGRLDPGIAEVCGISYVDGATGGFVRTEPRQRQDRLDVFPSPYLTGEYDHLAPRSWPFLATIEGTRGCPYGCTFCDWGSATMSRIRAFDQERVSAEVSWLLERGISGAFLADANFGILARDVQIAHDIVRHRVELDRDFMVILTPAKNTIKHLVPIIDAFNTGGVEFRAALGIQSVDSDTLAAANRSNISNDGFIALGVELRRRGLPLVCDLLIGLPGQTVESVKGDLQFVLDNECVARMGSVVLLPNAPMNERDYREIWGINAEADGLVTSSRSFTAGDRERMVRLQQAVTLFDGYGVLRHVLRFLQWDHGLPAIDVLERLIDRCAATPGRYPLLAAVHRHFARVPIPPIGWVSFYDEVAAWLYEEFGIGRSTALSTVFAVQRALMPDTGRRFPLRIEVDHDYVEYFRSATTELYTTGRPGRPDHRLEEYRPAVFEVAGDPHGLSQSFDLECVEDQFNPLVDLIRVEVPFEFESALMRLTTQAVSGPGHDVFMTRVVNEYLRRIDPEPARHGPAESTEVSLGATRRMSRTER